MKKIIGIGGSKGAGKNTASEYFTSGLGFKELSFAHPLKRACAYAFDLPYKNLNDPELKDLPFEDKLRFRVSNIDKLCEYLRVYYRDITEDQAAQMFAKAHNKLQDSPRKLLQFVGTELVRECIDDAFWCKAMEKDMEPFDKVVIPDTRFPNEREFLRGLGAELILIKRPGKESKDWHSSENSMGEDSEYDAVFTNDESIMELHIVLDAWFHR